MTSVEELLTQLRAARNRAERAIELAVGARSETEKAQQRFRSAAAGSDRPPVRATQQRWSAAREHLDKLIGRLLAGQHAVDVYINLIAGRGPTTTTVGLHDAAQPADVVGSEDHATRRARLRRELVRRGDDVVDATRSTAEALQNLIHPSTATHPSVAPDVAAGLLAGGILAAEATAQIGRILRRLKENDDHDD